MIAEIGHASLWLAAALALVLLVGGGAARAVAAAQALMALIALAALGDRLLLLATVVAIAGAMIAWRPNSSILLRLAAAVVLLSFAAVLRGFGSSTSLPMSIGLIGLAMFPWLIATSLPRGLSFGPSRRPWSRRSLHAKVGMTVALIGGGLAVIGAGSGLAFASRTVTDAHPGAMVPVGPWLVQFATVNPAAGPDWTAVEAALRASRGRGVSELHPQARTLIASGRRLSEPAVASFWDGRLSTAVEPGRDGAGRLQLVWTPLVILPWIGGALTALGGLIVLGGMGWRSRRRRRDRDE